MEVALFFQQEILKASRAGESESTGAGATDAAGPAPSQPSLPVLLLTNDNAQLMVRACVPACLWSMP